MKKIILLLLLNVFVLNLFAKEPEHIYEKDVVLIRHFYAMSNVGKPLIKIYKNNNEVESISLPSITDDDKNNSFSEIHALLQKYISDGYEISTSHEVAFTSTHGVNKVITTYVLEKKQ